VAAYAEALEPAARRPVSACVLLYLAPGGAEAVTIEGDALVTARRTALSISRQVFV
jgi:hypothetical protein